MNRHVYVVLIVLVSGWGCTPNSAPIQRRTIPIDSLYRIDLPSNLRPGYEMHDYASLQYYDTRTHFYVIGLEDSKENLGEIKRKQLKIDGYFDHLSHSAFEHMDSVQQIAAAEYINDYGIHVFCGDFDVKGANLSEMDLFYRVCVCEHPRYFYQLVVWMPFNTYCERIEWIDLLTESLRFSKDSIVPSPPLTTHR